MKFEFVQRIVERIRQDILCPRCNKKCGMESLDVCGVDAHNIDFLADCPHCGVRVHISAELTIASETFSTKNRPRNHRLCVQQLNDLKQTLNTFDGDVKDLFHS